MGTASRISHFATLPFSNENTRLVRVLWSPQQIPDTALMGVEQTQYFPGGRSATHSDDRSEEIIYFRRGQGEVQLDDKVVSVNPGSAVSVPKNVVHTVRNTGKDLLEHVLVTGNLTLGALPRSELPQSLNYIVKGEDQGLERLSLFRQEIPPGKSSEPLTLHDRECVYILSSGSVVTRVRTHDFLYDFEYLIDVSNSLWVPAGPRHSFRNIGDVPAVIIGFLCIARPDVPIN
jgi:mannose-6-phosphate isomerase-like protein (cupin superfamily)